MKHLITLINALTLLIIVNACSNSPKSGNNIVEPILVDIPVEFEQNREIEHFILEYQKLANEINVLAVEMISIVGFDFISSGEQLNEESLSNKQIKKISELNFKQARLLGKREEMLLTMNRQLPALAESEQRALSGVIGLIDAKIKRKADSYESDSRANLVQEASVEGSNNYDEETLQMLAEREAEIERLKESGEWEEPKQSNNNDIFFIIPLIAIGAFFLIFRLMFRKGINQSGSFARPKRTSFTQGLSHMGSEIKSNFEKIPFDQMMNDPNISDEDKKSFQKGQEFIMGLTSQKTQGLSGEKEQINPEDISLDDAAPIMSHENLKQLFDTELKPSIEGIETKRKGVVRSFIVMLVIIASILPVVLLVTPELYLNVIVLFVLIIAAIVFFVKGAVRYLKFRSEYKSSVVKKVVQFINPKYLYDANKHISLNDFIMSKLGSNMVNKAIGDDYVCGKIDKTVFEFSELVAQNEYETTDSEGKKVKQTDTHFNGLFFLADFNKHIQGETFVMPDTVERLLGKFGQSLQKSSKGDLVKLENPEFEKYFAVFSTNQTEARYILTPTMMEGMVNIRKKIGKNFYFSFVGERVYCGIEFNQALFEASIFRPVSFKDVEFMHSLFTLIETIVTEMNLNTRIWTKE